MASVTPQPTRPQRPSAQNVNYQTADPRQRFLDPHRSTENTPYAVFNRSENDPSPEDRAECYKQLQAFLFRNTGKQYDVDKSESNPAILGSLVQILDHKNPSTIELPDFYNFLNLIKIPKGVTNPTYWRLSKSPISDAQAAKRQAAIAWLVSVYEIAIPSTASLVNSDFWNRASIPDYKTRISTGVNNQHSKYDQAILEMVSSQKLPADISYSIQDINIPIAALSRMPNCEDSTQYSSVSDFVHQILLNITRQVHSQINETQAKVSETRAKILKVDDLKKETSRLETTLQLVSEEQNVIINSLNEIKKSIDQAMSSGASIKSRMDSEKLKLAELHAEIDRTQGRIESQQMSLAEAEQYNSEILDSQKKCEELRSRRKKIKHDRDALERRFKQEWKRPSLLWREFTNWLTRIYSQEKPMPDVLASALNIDIKSSRNIRDYISTVSNRTSLEEVIKNIKVHKTSEARTPLGLANACVLNFNSILRALRGIEEEAKANENKARRDHKTLSAELDTLTRENDHLRKQLAKISAQSEVQITNLTKQVKLAESSLDDRRNQSQSRLVATRQELEELIENQARLQAEVDRTRILQDQQRENIFGNIEAKLNALERKRENLIGVEAPKALQWISDVRDIQSGLIKAQVEHLPEVVRIGIMEDPEVCRLLGYEPPVAPNHTTTNDGVTVECGSSSSHDSSSGIEEDPVASSDVSATTKKPLLHFLRGRENFCSKKV